MHNTNLNHVLETCGHAVGFALAAALRDAGFTLSGGGVSQHPGEPRHGSPGRGATNFGLRLDDAPDDEIRPLRGMRAALGRLDLYA